MKVESRSEMAERFEREYSPLPYISQNGIWIYPLEQGGRLRVVLGVGETSTHEDIRAAIPLALQWRDALLEWQGATIGDMHTAFLERWSRRQQRGRSYAQLAEDVNRIVADYLIKFVEISTVTQGAVPTVKSGGDPFAELLESPNTYFLAAAASLLRCAGLKKKEIRQQLFVGLARIADGQLPFEKGYPVSRSSMREALRTWRQGKKHQSLQRKSAAHDEDSADR